MEKMLLSDNILALDETLIQYSSDEKNVMIPSEYSGIFLKTVGAGAILAQNAEEITLARGYTCLNNEPISCDKPFVLNLPDTLIKVNTPFKHLGRRESVTINLSRSIDATEYQSIDNSGKKVKDVLYFSPCQNLPASLKLAADLVKEKSSPLPDIIDKSPALFIIDRPTMDKNDPSMLFSPLRCIDRFSNRTETEEYTIVMEMIQRHQSGWYEKNTEKKNDLRLRSARDNREIFVPVFSYFTCSSDYSFSSGDKTEIIIKIESSLFFVPAIKQIRHKGKDWWLYSRNYLISDPAMSYLRENVGVFGTDGLVTDYQLSEEIYEKYRFISIL